MASPILDVAGVEAAYGKHRVLHGISLDVLPGETFGLIGLNGAGKTTLLKIILGLKEAANGRVTVGGSAAGSGEAQRQIAFLPERFDPPWFLNAYEFIDFTLSFYRRKASRTNADEMADRLGLKREFLKKRAQTYSKGMRQKLGLMATFMTDCPLLVLDEPMSGLDPRARAQVKDLVAGARAKGQTIFLSSHILSDLEELCDRIAVLDGGRIIYTGTPAGLIAHTGQKQLERAFLASIDYSDLAA